MNRNNILKNNKEINVIYHDQIVGLLALTSDNLCAFEYNRNWTVNVFSISPFKLPLEKSFCCVSRTFVGNLGVFSVFIENTENEKFVLFEPHNQNAKRWICVNKHTSICCQIFWWGSF